MNKNGQVLVIFVLLLPIVLLLMAIIVDVGNFLVIKNRYENEVKDTIRYSLKHNLDENKIKLLLDNNIKGDKEIIIAEDTLKIKVKEKVNSIFSLIDFNYEINISYIGYKENEKIKIKKE